jgi:hypothetical protein
MLVATRDPFHPGSNEPVSAPPPGGGSRLARTMSTLQIIGTVMAIPAAIGSAYSMYRTNFSADATCQSLRANIIQILDKGVDASARHMLVRRDVEAFEQRCGDVDPDAAAAFKTLLAVDSKAKAQAAQPVVARTDAKPKPVERKAEPKIEPKLEAKAESKPESKTDIKAETKIEPHQEVAKQPAAKPATVAVAPVQRDPATSDAAWLEAVRGALVAHEPAPLVAAPPVAATPIEPKSEPKLVSAPPVLRPAMRDAQPAMVESPKVPAVAPEAVIAPQAVTAPEAVTAPALPPPNVIASAPAPQADDGHPVPPGAIPDAPPTDIKPPENRSRIGALISHIPFVGRALDR